MTPTTFMTYSMAIDPRQSVVVTWTPIKMYFYAAGLPALISTGITLVYFLLKAYQFAVYAVSHQTEGRLAAATPGGRKQEHGSIEGEEGHMQVHEQVPGNISDQYGTGIQQPSGSISLSRRRKDVCLAARRNAEEYSVEPSVRENAKRLQSRRNRTTENDNGQGPGGAYGDSTGVFAEGGGWPNATNEQPPNDGRISSQERSDQNTPDGIPGHREPEKQVSDVSLQTDTLRYLICYQKHFDCIHDCHSAKRSSPAVRSDARGITDSVQPIISRNSTKGRRAVDCTLQLSGSGGPNNYRHKPRCQKVSR